MCLIHLFGYCFEGSWAERFMNFETMRPNHSPEPMPFGADGRPVLRGTAFAVDSFGGVVQLCT